MDTVKRKNLVVSFVKIKAHSGNKNNDNADLLAKQASQESILEWSGTGALKITTVPVWNNIIIDIGARDFVKILNRNKVAVEWTVQKRISKQWQDQIDNHQTYNWKDLWTSFKNTNVTSIKNSRQRGFWLKLMHNELPTLDRLATRRPDIYGGIITCCLCGRTEETREHLFSCPTLDEQNTTAWNTAFEKFKKEVIKVADKPGKGKKKQTSKSKNKLHNAHDMLDFFVGFENKMLGSQRELMNLALGLINKSDVKRLGNAMDNTRGTITKARDVLTKLSYRFRKYFREFTWKTRCKTVTEMEKTRGISNKDKKKKKKGKKGLTGSKRKAKSESNNQEKEGKALETMGKVQEVVAKWITEGTNWLGV